MADDNYQEKTYRKVGGDEFVVADGEWTVQGWQGGYVE